MTAGLFLAAPRHDRAVVLASLALVVLLAWTYLLLGGGVGMEMMDMGGGQMVAMPPEWTLGYGLVVFVMWAVMMLAMMLPSAAPVTLLIASLARKRAAAGGAVRASTALSDCPLQRRRCSSEGDPDGEVAEHKIATFRQWLLAEAQEDARRLDSILSR